MITGTSVRISHRGKVGYFVGFRRRENFYFFVELVRASYDRGEHLAAQAWKSAGLDGGLCGTLGGARMDHTLEIAGTFFFTLAVLHTFSVGSFQKMAHARAEGSVVAGVLHFLGEVEVVFGLWAAVFLLFFGGTRGFGAMADFMDRLRFTEPIFVFCLMAVASTRPILGAAGVLVRAVSGIICSLTRRSRPHVDVWTLLTLGPLAGSFITEPAAITVTALLLLAMDQGAARKFRYAVLAVLFVNVSVGGAITPYAAPPVLMVAQKWGWNFAFMATHFGFKVALICGMNALLLTFFHRAEIGAQMRTLDAVLNARERVPGAVTALHGIFLALLVLAAHHPNLLVGIFLLFLGVVTVFRRHHERLRLRESLLVGFFLAGLMVFGEFQAWWLAPVLSRLSDGTLFLGATGLTAVTDNAALTYLGSQVEGLAESSKYFLVAGALAGGGLTLIANAPNVAGFAILQKNFAGEFRALLLLRAALIPTTIAVVVLGCLPGF